MIIWTIQIKHILKGHKTIYEKLLQARYQSNEI